MPIKDSTKRREYFRAWAAQRAERVFAELDAYKLKHGCKDCGYRAHPAALQFDHLPQFHKVGNVSSLVSRGDKALWAEVAKCEVVCANCHAIRTALRRGLSVNGSTSLLQSEREGSSPSGSTE